MNLLDTKRKTRITQAPRRDQIKLDHMQNDINRARIIPSKNVSLMYCYNNNINNVVIMEKTKKSVSIIPKEKMNELRMGEKGTSITLNAINKKISMNQVKNVHSGYNKYWTYNGAIYGVKPGFIGRLDTGSTPSSVNVYDTKGFSELWYNMDIDVTNDRTKYSESGTDRIYKTVAPYTSWYGTDTYQLSDNLMNRSDKLSSNNMLRYNKVRSTYVNIPVNNTASPIMYGDYVYTSRLEKRTREIRPTYWCTGDGAFGDAGDMGFYNDGPYASVGEALAHLKGNSTHVEARNDPMYISYQVTVYDPQYIPGIIAPNNFKWVDIAQVYYKNNKIVRGQYNIGAYSSYANRYNNTPYYAADVSENRRSTYHNGIRTLWPRTTSILFEKSAGQVEPYPQPNVTYIGNLTNNKTHFNSLSEAKYA